MNKYLSDAEDTEDETDTDSIIEIIDRVKGTYRADAEARILEAERQAHAERKKYRADAEARVLEAKRQANVEGEKARQLELQIKGAANSIAQVISLILMSVVGPLIFVGLALCLPGVFDLWPGPRWTGWIAIATFGGLTVLGLYRGTSLKDISRIFQSTLAGENRTPYATLAVIVGVCSAKLARPATFNKKGLEDVDRSNIGRYIPWQLPGLPYIGRLTKEAPAGAFIFCVRFCHGSCRRLR